MHHIFFPPWLKLVSGEEASNCFIRQGAQFLVGSQQLVFERSGRPVGVVRWGWSAGGGNDEGFVLGCEFDWLARPGSVRNDGRNTTSFIKPPAHRADLGQ